jgi:hypothetical protein
MLTAAILGLAGAASAQDMRVYTTVSHVGDKPQQTRVVSHILTIFHAGKVYDHVEEAGNATEAGEVVVLEPVHDRFVIMNANYLAARVEFSQLQQLLKVAQFEAEKYLQEISVRTDRRSRSQTAALEFQLQPAFQEHFEPTLNRLQLTAPTLDYDVKTARLETPQLVAQYLTYADWAARLNYVLHPSATFPSPRLELNARMREKGVVATEVNVRSRAEKELHLRAEHRFDFKLQSSDKAHINKWERLFESDQVRWVSLHEYQQQTYARLAKSAE